MKISSLFKDKAYAFSHKGDPEEDCSFAVRVLQKIKPNIKVSDIKSKRRTREISTTRQIAMYLCREHTKSSLPEIGKQFGGKDHTTVIFCHKKIASNLIENKELESSIQDILGLIENGQPV